MKRNLFIHTALALLTVYTPAVLAGEFYTVIGPDGRPMVVERRSTQQTVQAPSEQQTNRLSQSAVLPAAKKDLKTSTQLLPKAELASKDQLPSAVVSSQTVSALPKGTKPVIQRNAEFSVPPAPHVQSTSARQDGPSKTGSAHHYTPVTAPLNQITSSQPEPAETIQQKSFAAQNEALVIVEGEQYIKSEYLEEKEFNVEGKKRFYTMPEGIIDTKHGATRLQVIEREKGIGRSVLDHLFKRSQITDSQPITLAATYYRVPPVETTKSLGQQCFNGKKLKRVKQVDLAQEVNIWPRAPLKEQFDFEIVKVGDQIQNIQINSYASRQHQPTFYWPFVAFLDAEGCVIEGAGGFKRQVNEANSARFKMIEGVIHVPEKTQYLLMTPLLSAPDVEDQVLSNQGQIKLIALR